MDIRDKLIRKFAKPACEEITRKTIRYLQSLTDCRLSGDDTELKNVWDEICVQVQYEESIYWDAYVETAKQSIEGHVSLLPMHVNQAIWLQTEDGFNWIVDNEDKELDFYGNTDAITDYIFREHLMFAASRWSNKRIEEFKERSARRD